MTRLVILLSAVLLSMAAALTIAFTQPDGSPIVLAAVIGNALIDVVCVAVAHTVWNPRKRP